MHLVRLVYVSRNRISDLQLPLAQEIRAIEAACDRNNPAASLTGALAMNERLFASVLEGDRVQVSRCLGRIARDPRHGEMLVLQFGAITIRRFDDWAVAYAGQSDQMERLYLRYGVTAGFDPLRMSVDSLVGLLGQMVASEATRVHHAPIFAAGGDKARPPADTGAAVRPVMPLDPALRPPPMPTRSGAAAFRVQAGPTPEDAT